MNLSTSTPLVIPPLWKRIVASLVDVYFIFMLAYALISLLPASFAESLRLVLFGLALLYEPICNATLGFTFGTFLFRLRIRKNDDPSQKLSFPKALLRFVVKLVLGGISFLTIYSDSQQRAIHDRVAGSIVIAR